MALEKFTKRRLMETTSSRKTFADWIREHEALALGGLAAPAIALSFTWMGNEFGSLLLAGFLFFLLALFIPFHLVALFALYLPFEGLIIYRFSGNVMTLLKHSGTILSWGLSLRLVLGVVFSRYLGLERRSLRPLPPGTIPLLFFIFWVFLSASVNRVIPYLVFKMLVQEARFIPLYTALVFAAPSAKARKMLLFCLGLAVVIQAGLGMAQVMGGETVGNLLALPEVLEGDDILAGGSNINTLSAGRIRIAGSTGSYSTYAVYLSIYVLLLISMRREMRREEDSRRGLLLFLVFLGLALIGFSYSRMSLAGLVAGYAVIAAVRRDWKSAAFLLICIITVGLLFLFDETDYSNFADQGDISWVAKMKESFSQERVGTSQEVGRLGVTLYALNLATRNPLLGVGPGNWGNILAFQWNEHTRSTMLSRNIPFMHYFLQDNNWASTLGQLGYPGTIAYFLIFLQLFRTFGRIYRESEQPKTRFLALAGMAITACLVVEGLFGPMFVIRLISFNYWCLMGLFIALLRERQAIESCKTQLP